MAESTSVLDGLRGLIPFSKNLPENTLSNIVGERRNYNWLAAAFISWINQEDQDRQSQYDTYRNYYDGEHLYQLTDRMKEFLELDPNVTFDLNYLPLAIDVLAERLVVLGFTGADGIAGNDGILKEWWKANSMDATQDDVHLGALRDGDTYLLVGWDSEKDEPIFTHEPAYDGEFGMGVRYFNDGTNNIRLAFKRWYVESGDPEQRMNVYTPAAIYKFITTSGGWDAYMDEDEEWPIPWVDGSGEPLGVPVAHFKNKGVGFSFGKSELHDLIPAQDALNKMVLDEIAGADVEGFGMITLSGGRPPDEDFEIGPRKILWSPDGVWGEIDAGDLVALSDMVHNFIVRIAQLSRTPLQYFQSTKQIASGETQRAYDMGIVSKAENRSKHFGVAWQNAMKIALRLDNVYGDGSWSEEQLNDFKTVYGTFERVDKLDSEKRRADVMVRLVEGGTSLKGALMVAGYSKEEQEALLDGAPLVSPIFLKAGGTGQATANLLTGDSEERSLNDADEGGDVASETMRG
jgi:hypothetical protein